MKRIKDSCVLTYPIPFLISYSPSGSNLLVFQIYLMKVSTVVVSVSL